MNLRKLLVVFTSLFICFYQVAIAQLTTSVDKRKIPLNDELLVTYNYSGNSRVVRVSNIQFKHFGVNGPLTESINNNGKIDYSITYILRPSQEGTFTIPGIQIETADGKVHESKSVIVEVTKAQKSSSQSSPSIGNRRQTNTVEAEMMYLESQLEMIEMMMANPFLTDNEYKRLEKYYKDLEKALNDLRKNRRNSNNASDMNEGLGQIKDNFFLRAEPSKKVAYKGEAIELVYRLYYTTPFSGGSINKLPNLDGFSTRDFGLEAEPKPVRGTFNGKDYMVLELKKSILYPTKVGELTIDGLQLSAYTERYGRLTIASDPVSIQVKELPTVENSSFVGGVGQFAISNTIKSTNFTTNDVIPINIIVAGKGNLEILNNPRIDGLPDNLYLTEPTSEIKYDEKNLVKGEKIFTYQLSVTQPGNYVLPQIPFTFFDTEKNEYITIKTEAIEFQVTQGANTSAGNDNNRINNEEVNYFKGDLPDIEKRNNWFTSPILWIASLLIITLIPLFVKFKNGGFKKLKDADIINTAEKVAKSRLKLATQLVHNDPNNQFYDEISKAVYLYLSNKLNIPLSDLSKNLLKEKLKLKGVGNDKIIQVIKILEECEFALYAGNYSNTNKEAILQEASTLITHFETNNL